jgi:hypothetical protein
MWDNAQISDQSCAYFSGPGLEYLQTDAFLDPFRSRPRFPGIERLLKCPD